MLGLGILFDVAWMQAVASAYLAFLWIPVTPEKILTMMIAIFFLKRFFPKDEKTLGILRDMFEKLKIKHKERKQRKKDSKSYMPASGTRHGTTPETDAPDGSVDDKD